MTALAFALLVCALMGSAAWGVGALTLPLGAALAGRWPRFGRFLPLVAALPALAAVALGAAALLPGDPHLDQPFGCHCGSSMPSWLHLCPVHPGQAMELLPLAAAALALWLPPRIRPLLGLLREPRGLGLGWDRPVFTALGWPSALLVGWLRPTLVVDPRLWGSLTPPERQAVLAHERGHRDRRDPMVLLALRLLTLVAPRPAAAQLVRVWLDHAEARADALAARAVGDPLVVAGALLRGARLAASAQAPAVGWTSGSLERRVHRLLTDPGGAASSRPDVGPVELLLLVALLILALGATPWVHHQVEHLLNLSL